VENFPPISFSRRDGPLPRFHCRALSKIEGSTALCQALVLPSPTSVSHLGDLFSPLASLNRTFFGSWHCVFIFLSSSLPFPFFLIQRPPPPLPLSKGRARLARGRHRVSLIPSTPACTGGLLTLICEAVFFPSFSSNFGTPWYLVNFSR